MKDLFENIKPSEIEENIFKLIGSDWMLVCAGKPGNYNMMTASWGSAGHLWNKDIAIAFVRPQRHTFSFMEEYEYFSLNFFEESYRKLLNLCGTKSGRDIDKMNIQGLNPLETEQGHVFFEQAQLVLECKKIYADDIKPGQFNDFNYQKIYPSKDYHRFYIGEIINSWRRKI